MEGLIGKKTLEKIFKLIDDRARALVGTLMKRLEVLDSQEDLTLSQIKGLYKSLVKENIYEGSRVLKELIAVTLLPSIKFKTKGKE